jgi:uncharacterized membrane protein
MTDEVDFWQLFPTRASMPRMFGKTHFYHHGRFYAAAGVGVLVYAAMTFVGGPVPVAAAGDAFFLAYLVAAAIFLFGHTAEDLKRLTAQEDEGVLVVVGITLAIIAVNVTGVFLALNRGANQDGVTLALILAAAPLGWFVLHTMSAFHYANLFYFSPAGKEQSGRALEFPGTKSPNLWDFLYFSFVIGMTAQVSDVQIKGSGIRRTVTGHSIVSFFFNTVLIALVVNAVVAGH